jgi:class 3 adenylate cyclase
MRGALPVDRLQFPQMGTPSNANQDLPELRLFIEEVCCNLCRFFHVRDDRVAPESVRIDTEFGLGLPTAYADIRVDAPGKAPYFIEVDYGYSADRIVSSLSRKYGPQSPAARSGAKVILVVDTQNHPHWSDVEERCRAALNPNLALEVWSEEHLLQLIEECYGASLNCISVEEMQDVRGVMADAEKRYAFGDAYTGDALEGTLIWHFGFLRLKRMRAATGLATRSLFPPALYRDVVILTADLAGFSAYVRDTREERVVRDCLTSFYAKSRYQIINSGGMVYQFLGDAVIGMFGIPDHAPGHVQAALDCSKSLIQIGSSVSNEWQRHIDRIQPTGGVHIGLAVGDVNVMSLRPFSRTHMGAVGDCINMAARLVSCAEAGQIVASNTFYQKLPPASQSGFTELQAVEAKNVGLIRAWKLTVLP